MPLANEKGPSVKRLIVLAVAALITPLLVVDTASAITAGSWSLYPAQATLYTTAVQQPINADGSSNFRSTGNSVIPVKFGLLAAPGPVVFQSILSDGTDSTFPGTNDFSFLSFTPSSALTFNQITALKASYAFTMGNCGGGSLRWSVRLTSTQSVFIYYGAHPNFTDCSGANSQSGVNVLSLSDARFDTSQFPGGTFYDTYTGALALVGTMPVIRASLVLDSGWFAGDQKATVTSATFNDNTFVPQSGSPSATCNLPAATIKVTKLAGAGPGPVNEPESIQPADNNTNFRVVDCKYMYNLASSSLSGVGTYKVEAVINGTPAAGAATFHLR